MAVADEWVNKDTIHCFQVAFCPKHRDRGPGTQEARWGQTFLGEKGMSSARI